MHWRRGGAFQTAMTMYLSSARASVESGFIVEGVGLYRSALSCAAGAGVSPLVQAEIAAILAGLLAFGTMDLKRAFMYAAKAAKSLGVPLPDFKVNESHVWRLGLALNMGAFSWVDRSRAIHGKSMQFREIAVYCWSIMSLALTLPVTNATSIAHSLGQTLEYFRQYVLLTTACMAPAASGTLVFTLANSLLVSFFPLGRWVVARTGLAQARRNLDSIEEADTALRTGVWTPYLRDKHENLPFTSRLASRIPLTINFVSAFLCSSEGHLHAYEGRTNSALAKWETAQRIFSEQRGQAIWESLVLSDRLALLLDRSEAAPRCASGAGGAIEMAESALDAWDADVELQLPPGFTRFFFTTIAKVYRYCFTTFHNDSAVRIEGSFPLLDSILSSIQTSDYALPAWVLVWVNCVCTHKHMSRILMSKGPHERNIAEFMSYGKQVIDSINSPSMPVDEYFHRSRLIYLPMFAAVVLRLMYLRRPGEAEAVSVRDALDSDRARRKAGHHNQRAQSDIMERYGTRTSFTPDAVQKPQVTDISRVDIAAALQTLRKVALHGAKCQPFMALRCGIVAALVAEACLDVDLRSVVSTIDSNSSLDIDLRNQLGPEEKSACEFEMEGLYVLEAKYHKARLLGEVEKEEASRRQLADAAELCPTALLFSSSLLHNVTPAYFLQPDALPDVVSKKHGCCA